MICFGFDPGSSRVGYAGIRVSQFDCSGKPFSHIVSGSIDVGHSIPLAKPKRVKGGNPILNETVIDDQDLANLRETVRGILLPLSIETSVKRRVIVERVIHVYPRGRLAKMGGIDAPSATYVANAQWVGAEIAAIAVQLGYETITRSADDMRQAAIGKRQAEDSEVKAYVLSTVKDWPSQSNSHGRDGAVAAIAGAVL